MEFSKVVFPSNDMEIHHLPEFADVAFANLIISCGGGHSLSFSNVVERMRENDPELKRLSVEDVIWKNQSHDLSLELRRFCWFTYRSTKTNELYQQYGLKGKQRLGTKEMEALKKKMIAYYFRISQQSQVRTSDEFDHSSDTWKCEEDARLLEILLNPKWRHAMEFAINTAKGSDAIDSPATTVWHTVIAVLYNNFDKHKPKARFPTDLDFWHFSPSSKKIVKYRSGELLRDRLVTLNAQFAKLMKIYKKTGSLYRDLPKPAQITFTKDCTERNQENVTKLTTMYMFEIWSRNQNDAFINRAFGVGGRSWMAMILLILGGVILGILSLIGTDMMNYEIIAGMIKK